MVVSDMQKGSIGVIGKIGGESELVKRLKSLGVERGAKIKALERSIGAANIQVLCNSLKIGLRDVEASNIEVVAI